MFSGTHEGFGHPAGQHEAQHSQGARLRVILLKQSWGLLWAAG